MVADDGLGGVDRQRERPAVLTLAAASLGLQAVAVLVVAVLELVHLDVGRATLGVTTALFLAAYGVGLGACAVGLARLRSWARGPAVLAQLIELGLAWSNRHDAPTLSVVLAVVAVVTLVAIFSRPALEALEG